MSTKDYEEQMKECATGEEQIEKATLNGERQYTEIKCPRSRTFALPHDHGCTGVKMTQWMPWEMKTFEPLVGSFEADIPAACAVCIARGKAQGIRIQHGSTALSAS